MLYTVHHCEAPKCRILLHKGLLTVHNYWQDTSQDLDVLEVQVHFCAAVGQPVEDSYAVNHAEKDGHRWRNPSKRIR